MVSKIPRISALAILACIALAPSSLSCLEQSGIRVDLSHSRDSGPGLEPYGLDFGAHLDPYSPSCGPHLEPYGLSFGPKLERVSASVRAQGINPLELMGLHKSP